MDHLNLSKTKSAAAGLIVPYFLILLVAIGGCKKSSPSPKSNVDVYIAGTIIGSNGLSVATVWKNGVAIKLGDGSANSFANGIVVSNDDIYVAGSVDYQAAYWKNGILTKLGYYPWESSASGIAVKNGDIYISGYTTTTAAEAVATYWKNDIVHRIAADTTLSTYGTSIAINGSDIYVAGWSNSDRADEITFPLYWKNGSETSLTRLSKHNNSTGSILINNNDVYIAGATTDTSLITRYLSKAAIWKNGVLQILPSGGDFAEAHSLVLSGSDIYVVGGIVNDAVYWKNGIAKTLATGTPPKLTYVGAIALNGQDVYIAGTLNGQAVYWKNDVLMQLAPNGTATGIVVIPH
jgi:hypothetical protein